MSSKTEYAAAPIYAAMPVPAYPRQTFAPELSEHYLDGAGVRRKGLPDFVCHQPLTSTFIEHKSGRLNHHLSQDSSHEALQREYGWHRPQTHSFLSEHFYKNGYGSGRAIALSHAYNHSLLKVAALQALHGPSQYIVVFQDTPKPEDAQAYCEAGLVWCTQKTLPHMLACIEFAASGYYFPFTLRVMKYTVVIDFSPDPAHAGLSPDEVVAARRTRYEGVISEYVAARAAAAADTTLPF